ncbi:MAG: DNA polymerase beta superfamily protein, partial [Bradymonadaceae bacterium]
MRHDDLLQTRPHPDRDLYEVRVEADGQTLVDLGRVAFICPTGSHLYGTDDDQSDYDLKGVFLADLDAILLDRDRDNVRGSTSGGDDVRNVPGDVDAEFIELRKFIRDALDGQTYAVEMLHAPPELTLRSTPLWEEVLEARDRLISRRVEPFVGYCRAQARKYGRKGDRLAAIERVLETLEAAGVALT